MYNPVASLYLRCLQSGENSVEVSTCDVVDESMGESDEVVIETHTTERSERSDNCGMDFSHDGICDASSTLSGALDCGVFVCSHTKLLVTSSAYGECSRCQRKYMIPVVNDVCLPADAMYV